MESPATRQFINISKTHIDLMFNELMLNSARITGSNPWDIVTNQHGVVLRAVWSETSSVLAVSIARSNWYVPHDLVWQSIDVMMRQMQGPET